ncbi:MAG: substrate-binding domain-containing protein [Acidimicrobiales bacterium]|nr:substrate-binding domain-containing protein [Acidimicrobiales bacterium]HRW38507.1 substrate-binding domain-containing protein [Aquihabitans sp.]
MRASWRIAIPLAVVVAVIVAALVWMFAGDDGSGGQAGKKRNRGQEPVASSTSVPGEGLSTGLDEQVTGELVLYGVPAVQGALKAMKAGFESTNPKATITIVTAPVLDLVAALAKDPRPGALIAPVRAVDAVKGVSSGLGSPEPLGRNLFVITVPEGNPKKVQGLDAFAADSGLKVLACGPQSAYGDFAQLVLDDAGVAYDPKILAPACSKKAVKKVGKGTLDAALVMRTAERPTVQAVPVPDDVNIKVEISIVQVGEGDGPAALLTYAGSEAGQSILTDRGFLP